MRSGFLTVFFVKIGLPVLAAQNSALPFYLTSFEQQCFQEDYCFTLDSERSHANLFSTKNPYRTESHDRTSEFNVEGCEPARIWLLIRHGTRLPTAKGIKRFREMEKFRDAIVENVRSKQMKPLCQNDWEMFKQWTWNNSITADQANYLVEQGYKELAGIAHNFRRYLPNLFGARFDEADFHFRHTDTERTRSSFRAFVNGLFGDNAHKQIDAEQPRSRPDYLLKAYANCGMWREQKMKLKQSNSEVNKFQNAAVFQKFIADVNSRLGFNGTLTAKQIKDIYDMCRYEQAWQTDKASVWCSLLTPSQVHIIEYQEDLNYFYKSSHGSKLNKNVKCFAMNDMLKRLSNDNDPRTTVYFSHSAAVQLLLTSLGALKDEIDLRADNFPQMSVRKWRTSKISPFAANVAVVRYKCQTNDFAKFFLNEKTLYFDWCTANGVCDWRDVEQKYAFYTSENCNVVFCPNQL